MNIFISWSKDKSEKIAFHTKKLLEALDEQIYAFDSEVDINGGEESQKKIINNINECDKLVICFTKENKKAPWLLFEAGYARGLEKTVIPILFDEDPYWHSWVDNPMNFVKEIRFNSKDFTTNLLKALNLTDCKETRQKVEAYKKTIKGVKEKFCEVDIQCEDFIEKLATSDAFVMKNPFFKDKTAYFLTGFESFDLYNAIINSFLNTGKYLWIYGRKNMKLFGGSFNHLFKYLKDKTLKNDMMDGIDFRCLFLDPDSEEVSKAHPQQKIFKTELEMTLLRAQDVIGENNKLSKCFRLYSNKREEIIIRIDNCIICSRPSFDAQGRPQLLTNSSFEVFSACSEKGKECVATFEKIWNYSKDFS